MCNPLRTATSKLVIASLLSLLIAGCGDDEDKSNQVTQNFVTESPKIASKPVVEVPTQKGWDAHLSKLPNEFVSAARPLTIEFTHPVAGTLPLNHPIPGLVEIEPKVELKAYFASDRVVKIEPVAALNRATEYQLIIFPHKLDGIDNDLAPKKVAFKVFKQDYSVQINGLQIDSKSGNHSITGTIVTNDDATPEQIAKLLTATQASNELKIDFTNRSDIQYDFSINDVKREEQQTLVTISWNGAALGIDKKGTEDVTIPARASFEITGMIGYQITDQYIEVNFSEPLDRNQNVNGLVKINNSNPKNIRIDGNRLKVYPARKLSGDVDLLVLRGVKSTKGNRTTTEYKKQLTFLSEKPGVRFSGTKYIIPKDGDMKITIEAVNVDSVQITAYRTPINNLGQFLQASNHKRTYVNNQTSNVQWKKTYYLPEIPKDKWLKYDLSLENIAKEYGNDLLGLEIKIDRSNIILDCGEERPKHNDEIKKYNTWATSVSVKQPSWVNKYYKTQGYSSWRDRNNPCKDYYYRYGGANKQQFRYFSSSNLGIIAKMAVDHKMHVVVTDINTASPVSDVKIKAYNYQHQPVAEVETNSEGIAEFYPVAAPYYVVAQYNDDISFIRLNRNEALSTNIFDVGGEKTSTGLKGFFYGERGVWRPGDNIYLTFIVHDKTGNFPENYPLTLDFFDPKGIKRESITQVSPLNGFYHFKLSTDKSAPTGNWRAVVRYGNQYFDKQIPVEAIVPNRLKIELDFPGELLTSKDNGKEIGIFSQWLHGAVANELKADVKMVASASKTKVSGYDGFIFDDPARKLKSRSKEVFDGVLDKAGKASFKFTPYISNAPGQVKLNFTTRVFEKGGNFSTQYISKRYMPYDQLVGLNIPDGSGWNNSISREDKHKISFLTIDPLGERKADNPIEFTIYRIGWRWWWDYSNDNISSYVNGRHSEKVLSKSLMTDKDGAASLMIEGKDYDWGRYLFRVCNKVSDHCSGKVVYLGWSYNNNKNPSGETQLMLTTDKKEYNVGDKASLTIPQVIPKDASSARLLLTLESGTRILSQQWITSKIENNRIEIPVTEEMAPNVYAHVTLVQAYQGKSNDRPVRMYGIAPIIVNSKNSKLAPVISTSERVRPRSKMKIDVSEKSGKPMTYTLAVVDEGLLGITNFRTPDPRKSFYKREALGVLTWDIYDLLSQTKADTFNSLITLGGGDNNDGADGKRKKRRYPPVVKFLGPFRVEANTTASHEVQLPEYMGAVRVMVVAANQADNQAAYGVAEKTVTVSQPLGILATLPRVLGPNEEFSLPVSVFANGAEIKKVKLSVTTNDLFLFDKETQEVEFEKPGDKIVNLAFSTRNAVGAGSVTVTANSNGESISQTINIPVRSANLPQTISMSSVVEAGQNTTLSLTPNGMLNTNSTYLEISRVPDINLASRLDYLISYPHGCLEQTTSKLFPQIYLKNLTTLSAKQIDDVEYHVREGIKKLQTFQRADGAFNYWPNGSYYNRWANSYAGHFLLEARKLGYVVPDDVLQKWIKSQQRLAADPNTQRGYESTEAYTLYTLVLANKTDFNAMNRLKERISTINSKSGEDNNFRLARWLLAASYARAGIKDAAEEIMYARENRVSAYVWSGYTYGSGLRDTSVLMLAQSDLKNDTRAWESALEIAEYFKDQKWYSTQSTAWALTALSNYFTADQDAKQQFSYRVNDGIWEKLTVSSPVFKQSIDTKTDPVSIEIKNESGQNFYALLGNKGVPANAEEKAEQSNVSIDIDYTDMKGVPIDISTLKQGTDFKAKVTVTALDDHARLENLALTMIMPSGWQISNDRLEGKALAKGLEFQDFRDDRLLSYFTLGKYYWYHRYDSRSITVEATLNASFKGRYYLPGWRVESMYDRKVKANTVGQWIEVVEN